MNTHEHAQCIIAVLKLAPSVIHISVRFAYSNTLILAARTSQHPFMPSQD